MTDDAAERRELIDWRVLDEGLDDGETAPAPLVYTAEFKPSRIDITLEDGRSLWIEAEKSVLRVHAYDSVNDEPVNLNVDIAVIGIDTQDRD